MTDMLLAPTDRLRAPGAAPYLLDEVDGPLTCTEVTRVTHDVLGFTFALPDGAGLRFLPGQHLTFRLEVDGRAVERCYTVSSPPTRPDRLTITVKRVPGGVVSPWLHEHLRPGDTVLASGPLGRFSHVHHPAGGYLFLTAGSGITPAMSMLRTIRETGDPADVVLVHCARTPADIVFRDELAALTTHGGTSVALLCEDDAPRETWRGRRGRLDLGALLEIAPDLREREVFTCGPPPFMAAVREMLDLVGADPRRCHEESFELGTTTPPVGTDGPPGPGAGAATGPGTGFAVSLRRSDRTIRCEAGTTVLEAAALAGVALPSSCGEGLCGTCKTTLLSGEVDMQHAGGIRPREVAAGKFLPCCSTPLGDLEVDA
jgi:glycine betaine catabolism B